MSQGILFFGTLDSVTIAHRDAFFDAALRLSATKPDRAQITGDRINYLFNVGRPGEAAKWIDTLATLNRQQAGLTSLLGECCFGGGPSDTTLLNAEQRATWRYWRGDLAAGQHWLAAWRGRAGDPPCAREKLAHEFEMLE